MYEKVANRWTIINLISQVCLCDILCVHSLCFFVRTTHYDKPLLYTIYHLRRWNKVVILIVHIFKRDDLKYHIENTYYVAVLNGVPLTASWAMLVVESGLLVWVRSHGKWTFALFKLLTLQCETYFFKWEAIYLKF